jgi:hypothetical protein
VWGCTTSELLPNLCHDFDLSLSTCRRALVHVVHSGRLT